MGIAKCGKTNDSFKLKSNETKIIDYRAPLIISDNARIKTKNIDE